MQNVEVVLAQLAEAVSKFEAGYAQMTEARARLHEVAKALQVDKLQASKPAPVLEAKPQSSDDEEGGIEFDVLLWSSQGEKAAFSGVISGFDLRVVAFESEKEGIAYTGKVMPPDAQGMDDSVGYFLIKLVKDKAGNPTGVRMSLKFDQKDTWFNGDVVQGDKSDLVAHLVESKPKPKKGLESILGGTSPSDVIKAQNQNGKASLPFMPDQPEKEPTPATGNPLGALLSGGAKTEVLTKGESLPPWLSSD